MPKHPERPYRTRNGTRRLLIAAFSLGLAGCAATPEADVDPARPSPLLQQIASRMPGDYLSVQDDGQRPQSLAIESLPGDAPRSLGLRMVQSDSEGDNVRRYGLKLESTEIENRLAGEFALLDAQGQSRHTCAMTFHATSRRLVGETEPASCRFGDGDDTVGLLKEIAFDGSTITIGDRLVDPESGEALGHDRVIRFMPLRQYEGWLGVREGDEWRVAREFELATGESIEPLDAAEMSLGVRITLDYYRMDRDGDQVLMRLTVLDHRSGKVLAESWATPGSTTLGIVLPDLQVGLRRPD